MINFIKWNWKQLLGIAACIAAVLALNAIILSATHGCYNLISILFV
jgi:hypothetical protein